MIFSNKRVESVRVINCVYQQEKLIVESAELITNCLKQGGKLLWCGNGGSAAEAQHMSAEYMVRFTHDREPLASISLTSDTSLLTAHVNDFDYATLFARQITALGHEGDVLIAISTSGKSENILTAIETAKNKGMKVIFLKGKGESNFMKFANIVFSVDSDSTARIQEGHTLINHLICECVEALFK